MHSNNPMIPFTPDDLRLNATIRHELIIDTLVSLARGNRGNTVTPRNLPRGIGIQIGKVRIHVMHAMVMRNLGLHVIRQKLSIYLAAADYQATGSSATCGKRLVDTMHHVDALGSKVLIAREHDIAAGSWSGRPPGKLSSVLRPIMTGNLWYTASKNGACRRDWTRPCHPRTQCPNRHTRQQWQKAYTSCASPTPQWGCS